MIPKKKVLYVTKLENLEELERIVRKKLVTHIVFCHLELVRVPSQFGKPGDTVLSHQYCGEKGAMLAELIYRFRKITKEVKYIISIRNIMKADLRFLIYLSDFYFMDGIHVEVGENPTPNLKLYLQKLKKEIRWMNISICTYASTYIRNSSYFLNLVSELDWTVIKFFNGKGNIYDGNTKSNPNYPIFMGYVPDTELHKIIPGVPTSYNNGINFYDWGTLKEGLKKNILIWYPLGGIALWEFHKSKPNIDYWLDETDDVVNPNFFLKLLRD